MKEAQYLFEVQDNIATEVMFGHIEFSDEVEPIYEGSSVTKELPIMVEGKYSLLDRTTKKYRNVTITAEDIRNYHAQTKRDVAINYEHVQRKPSKGWVRLKDTARIGTMKTRTGEKVALFSRLELTNEGRTAVQAGFFRDVSIELKPVSREITGLALTSTPIMGDLQFFSLDVGEEPEVNEFEDSSVLGTGVQISLDGNTNIKADNQPESEPEPTTASFAEPDPNPTIQEEQTVETPILTEEQKTQAAAQALLHFGLTPDDIQAFKAQKAKSDLVLAKEKIKALSQQDGKQVLAPAGVEVAAQLLLFAQSNDEQMFSVEGSEDQVNAEALLTELFRHINAVQLYGETDGMSAQDLEPKTPDNEIQADEDRLARMTQIAKRAMRNL